MNAAAEPTLPPHLDERVRRVGDRPVDPEGAYVLYWMRTGVRGHDNPALDTALEVARQLGVPAFVYHAVSERYPHASDRHHRFILEGARDVAEELAERGVGYVLQVERPGHRGPHLHTLADRAALVVTEDMPVPPLTGWTRSLAEGHEAPVWAVDTACVVPIPFTAPQAIDRAFRFRKATKQAAMERVYRVWEDVEAPGPAWLPADLPFEPVDPRTADLDALIAAADIDHAVAPVPDTPGGSRAGYQRWRAFLANGLGVYARKRNDAAIDGVSRMSAYLHYGHVSPLRIARQAAERGGKGAEKYLDELLVWREMAYHWCASVTEPGSFEHLPDWAQRTLREHAGEHRSEPRSLKALARARSGSGLWDLAQQSLLVHGELHNNVRMTWGKGVIRWTDDPVRAHRRTQWLNDHYALDGRDPASFVSILWCYGGFDRPFDPPSGPLGRVRGRSIRRHASRLDMDAYARRVQRPRRPFLPRVAVVGAGVAGLACARTLADHGLEVVAFDKGRGAGGRLSTRRGDGPIRWDHGAPCLSVTDRRFGRMVRSWMEDGHVARWRRRVARHDGTAWRATEDDTPRFVGVPGMNAVVKHLAEDVDVRFGTRVTALVRDADRWRVQGEDDETLAVVDRVVVAVPAPQAAVLLGGTPLAAALGRVEVRPTWTLLVEAPVDLAAPVDDGWLGSGPLARVVRQASKPGRERSKTWVAHAQAAWTDSHLELAKDEVASRLLPAFAAALDTDPELLDAHAHRWRYARVVAPAAGAAACLVDEDLGLVACGDGVAGDGIEAAWRSGVAAAGRVLAR